MDKMVSFGIGKRGKMAGVWYIAKGLERVSCKWTRNGRTYNEDYMRDGRTYIYPEEGDVWELTYYYFEKVKSVEEYTFTGGKFFQTSINHYHQATFYYNEPGETVKLMREMVI